LGWTAPSQPVAGQSAASRKALATRTWRRPSPHRRRGTTAWSSRLGSDHTPAPRRFLRRALTGGIDGDKPAYEFLIEQDRDIAEKSGRPPLKIKSIARAGAKKKERDYSEWRAD
jgi:hypothetical protein